MADRKPPMEIQRQTPVQNSRSVNEEGIADAVAELLIALGHGEGLEEGLEGTPRRVARMWTEFFKIDKNTNTVFEEISHDQMIAVRGITGWSFCEHHILPFSYKAAVGYIPNNHIVGLSKIPRIVRNAGRGLQIQERMTSEIADYISLISYSPDVAVRMEGVHLCSVMRGVKAEGATLVTQELRGAFMDQPETRQEFLELSR